MNISKILRILCLNVALSGSGSLAYGLPNSAASVSASKPAVQKKAARKPPPDDSWLKTTIGEARYAEFKELYADLGSLVDDNDFSDKDLYYLSIPVFLIVSMGTDIAWEKYMDVPAKAQLKEKMKEYAWTKHDHPQSLELSTRALRYFILGLEERLSGAVKHTVLEYIEARLGKYVFHLPEKATLSVIDLVAQTQAAGRYLDYAAEVVNQKDYALGKPLKTSWQRWLAQDVLVGSAYSLAIDAVAMKILSNELGRMAGLSSNSSGDRYDFATDAWHVFVALEFSKSLVNLAKASTLAWTQYGYSYYVKDLPVYESHARYMTTVQGTLYTVHRRLPTYAEVRQQAAEEQLRLALKNYTLLTGDQVRQQKLRRGPLVVNPPTMAEVIVDQVYGASGWFTNTALNASIRWASKATAKRAVLQATSHKDGWTGLWTSKVTEKATANVLQVLRQATTNSARYWWKYYFPNTLKLQPVGILKEGKHYRFVYPSGL